MPFCTHCGNKVAAADSFCAGCGSRQSAAANPYTAPPPGARAFSAPPPNPRDPLANISPRHLSIFCYIPVVGCVAAVAVLGSKRFRNDLALRFHAFQGLYIFAAWLVDEWVIRPIFSHMPDGVFRVDNLLSTALTIVWLLMMYKTQRGETYSLPVLGELAQRSAQEHS